METTVERLTELWWIRLPQTVRRLAVRPVLVLVDGLYLTAWPRVAAFLPPLALLLGLIFGAAHPGFRDVFSQSWPVLILAVLLGIFSGHLGALFLAGFAVGDFFLFHTEWAYRGSFLRNLFQVRVPLLIEYGLLAFMTTGIALATKSLLAQLRPPERLAAQARIALAVAGHLGLTLLFVYLWMQVVPILIRPVFTWPGGSPPVDAMEILQRQGWPLLVIAAIASLGRMGLQQLVARREKFTVTVDERERQLNNTTPLVPLSAEVPPLARVAITSVWSTLMLSGMLERWWEGLILLLVISALQLARAGIIVPAVLRPWAAQIRRVPLPWRLAIGVLVTSFVARVALGPALARTNSFRPILLLTIFALLVFYMLDPWRDDAQPLQE